MQDINATLNTNFAKMGFYNDQTSLMHSAISRELIDKFAADGYGGVLFEITVGVNTDGTLQNKLTYNELFALMDYADKKGLKNTEVFGLMPSMGLELFILVHFQIMFGQPESFLINPELIRFLFGIY